MLVKIIFSDKRTLEETHQIMQAVGFDTLEMVQASYHDGYVDGFIKGRSEKTCSRTQRYDYSRLRRLILELYGTVTEFAVDMGLSAPTMAAKLSNRSYWKLDEIALACGLLGIPDREIDTYFFARTADTEF